MFPATEYIEVCCITKGPRYHWFGYYDKHQFDSTGRYVLGVEVDFQHRRPGPDDVIHIGMIDLIDKKQWIEIGQSKAWCWQSGCMLQWRPGSDKEVMWNDREKDQFITWIYNILTGERRKLPFPFFCVHPDGKTALGLDFERLEYMRPGYGYAGVEDVNDLILAPDDSGIYSLDLETGEKKLIFSLANAADIPHPTKHFEGCKHYFNCLLFNPTGTRFAFLHRWREQGGKGWPFRTRMMTADSEGKNCRVLVPGGCGHFNWRDSEHLLIQAGGFYLYRDGTGKVKQIGKGLIPDSGGHISYLPGSRWLVGDTYPNKQRYQKLYLYHIQKGYLIQLGKFFLPSEYSGSQSENVDDEWRCDLHPRISRDGKKIVIDSAHEGLGRQMYLIDISNILDKY